MRPWKCLGDQGSKNQVQSSQETLLVGHYLETIRGATGEMYVEAVRKCLIGGEALGVQEHNDESGKEVGLRIQELFAKEVVHKLRRVIV